MLTTLNIHVILIIIFICKITPIGAKQIQTKQNNFYDILSLLVTGEVIEHIL